MKISDFEEGTIFDEFEIDYYVPVSLEFPLNDSKKEELYYYRFINKKSSFIEIKINSKTRKIASVTVTSINDIKESHFCEFKVEEGNPIIKTDIFNKDTIITKDADFDILKGKTSLYFKLNEERLSTIIRMSKHLSLLLNEDNEIIGMEFSGFSKKEWKEINDNIKDSLKLLGK